MAGRSTVYAPRRAAATSQPLATAAALKILQDGGSAIDAAVAAAAVLNVTEPHMTGIGGDMFAILWPAEERRLIGLDASGKSGSKVDVGALIDEGADGAPANGARSVTVPGALSGWSSLVERYGSMAMADVLAPAIRIADEGFPVTPVIAQDWGSTVDGLRLDTGAAATFLIDGQAPEAGDWFRNPDLARTFQRIADHGPETFYGGELGQEVVAGLDELGGYITMEDRGDHRIRWVEPLSVEYRGYTLHELPPAGQGIAALQMLKMLDAYDLRSMEHNSAEYLHRQDMQVWAHSMVFPTRPLDVVRSGVDVISHVCRLAWEAMANAPAEYRHDQTPQFGNFSAESPVFTELFREMKNRGTILDATLAMYVRSDRLRRESNTTGISASSAVASNPRTNSG